MSVILKMMGLHCIELSLRHVVKLGSSFNLIIDDPENQLIEHSILSVFTKDFNLKSIS